MFKLMQLKSLERRSFQLTVGLEEGYGTGIKHTIEEVKALIGKWLEARRTSGQKSLSGSVSDKTMIYAWDVPAGGVKVANEDIAVFSGEVSPVYCADYSDADVEAVLFDLAVFLGETLKQTRMYVAYKDRIHVLENDQAPHPTRKIAVAS